MIDRRLLSPAPGMWVRWTLVKTNHFPVPWSLWGLTVFDFFSIMPQYTVYKNGLVRNTHARTHTHVHTHTYTLTRTHMHVHTRTHTIISSLAVWCFLHSHCETCCQLVLTAQPNLQPSVAVPTAQAMTHLQPQSQEKRMSKVSAYQVSLSFPILSNQNNPMDLQVLNFFFLVGTEWGSTFSTRYDHHFGMCSLANAVQIPRRGFGKRIYLNPGSFVLMNSTPTTCHLSEINLPIQRQNAETAKVADV